MFVSDGVDFFFVRILFFSQKSGEDLLPSGKDAAQQKTSKNLLATAAALQKSGAVLPKPSSAALSSSSAAAATAPLPRRPGQNLHPNKPTTSLTHKPKTAAASVAAASSASARPATAKKSGAQKSGGGGSAGTVKKSPPRSGKKHKKHAAHNAPDEVCGVVLKSLPLHRISRVLAPAPMDFLRPFGSVLSL